MRSPLPFAVLSLAVLFSSCAVVPQHAVSKSDGGATSDVVSGFLRSRYNPKAVPAGVNAVPAAALVEKKPEEPKSEVPVTVPAPAELSPAAVVSSAAAPVSVADRPQPVDVPPVSSVPDVPPMPAGASSALADDGLMVPTMRPLRDPGGVSAPARSATPAPLPPAAELRGLRSPQLPTGLPMSLDGKIIQQQGE